MNKEEKVKYDFRAIKETIKDSVVLHKDIVLEISKSLELRHLKLLENKNKLQFKLDEIKKIAVILMSYNRGQGFDLYFDTLIKSILGDEKDE